MDEHRRDRNQTKSTQSTNFLRQPLAFHPNNYPKRSFYSSSPTNTFFCDGKNNKFELSEDFFQSMLKMQSEMAEAMKTNSFSSHLQKQALQSFCNIKASNKRTVENVLTIFGQMYVGPQK